jgi:hypothetical protein
MRSSSAALPLRTTENEKPDAADAFSSGGHHHMKLSPAKTGCHFLPPKRGVEFNFLPPKRGVEFNFLHLVLVLLLVTRVVVADQ